MSLQKKVPKSALVPIVIDEQDISEALKLVQDIGQYENVIYHMAYRTNSSIDVPFLKSTYPFSWLGRYLEQQYQDIDPVIIDGFEKNVPFFWSELERSTPERIAFFEDAATHGAGRNGFSIPLFNKSQRKAMFTVTTNLNDDDWRKKIATERKTLEQIADILHRKAILHVYGSEEGPSLAPREIECLYWTAKGKDGPTVAEILSLSEHTVRDYIKSARHKLGCHTIAQTIHEATKRRLISF
ncbi:MAG: LuxR family transcriptional regulator [Salaquimonas sp.]